VAPTAHITPHHTTQYALELLAHSRKLFNAEPTLQPIVIPEGHRLTLVGDLHGQLQDLFTIFTLNGLPSEVRACVRACIRRFLECVGVGGMLCRARQARRAQLLNPIRSIPPSVATPQESEYLFNGDLVDRGAYGAEVLFTILAFKCLFPCQVRVNRGNHECRQQVRACMHACVRAPRIRWMGTDVHAMHGVLCLTDLTHYIPPDPRTG